MQGNPYDVLGEGFTEHLAVAGQFFVDNGVTVRKHCTELVGVVEHGPMVTVTHRMLLGEENEIFSLAGEQDHVMVVGFYIPHDGNVTTVINHMDGCKVLDNADAMFPPQAG